MNNCLILLLLLFCCGNQGCSDDFRSGGRPCGERNNDGPCGRGSGNDCGCGRDSDRGCGNGRDSRNDCGNSRDSRNDCGCGSGRDLERGFTTFPSPGGTCGCEEKE